MKGRGGIPRDDPELVPRCLVVIKANGASVSNDYPLDGIAQSAAQPGKNLFGNRSLNDLEKQAADHRAAQHGFRSKVRSSLARLYKFPDPRHRKPSARKEHQWRNLPRRRKLSGASIRELM
jgi:hypothetical protein